MDVTPMPITLHRVLIAGLVFAATTMGRAQSPDTQAIDGEAEARAVIDLALKRYRDLNTYQDRMEHSLSMAAQDRDGHDASSIQRSTISMAYGGPDRFLITNDAQQYRIFRNHDRQWFSYKNIYTESEPKQPTDFAAAVPPDLRSPEPAHTVAAALSYRDRGFAELFPEVRSVTAVEAEPLQGAMGKRVKGTVELFKGPFAQTVPFSAWFANADGLLREIVIDVTAAAKRAVENLPPQPGQPAVVERCHLIIRFDEIVTDAKLPKDHFTFKPGKDNVRVPSITPDAFQMAMIGRPAPPFTGDDKDGKRVSLKDNLGRIVVIDFWATWCGPCIAALPTFQKIADRYADRPVTFIGINNDEPELVNRARNFLEKRNITIPQFWDTDNAVSIAYRINGIPCTVLVDTKGVIQDIHLGFKPAQLRTNIETLLEGGSLLQEH